MNRRPSRTFRRMHGFSLLELMVSLVIGMFSVLVIMQVLAGTATSRRIAIGGGDAQLNGVAAMRALELDIEHAGLGLQSFNISGCSLSYVTTGDAATVTLPALVPVVVNPATAVVPAGDANTDVLLVASGNSSSPSEGDSLTAATSGTAYVVTTPDAFVAGDQVLAAAATRGATCALQLARVTAVSGYTLTVSGGTAGLPSGSVVYNLGSAPTVRAYAIRNGDLTVCDYLAYNCGSATYASTYASTGSSLAWVPVASNMVSLRAQYARDTSGIVGAISTMDGVVDSYDQVTPGSAGDATAIPLYCRWARVIGVQMVLVARNPQFVRPSPTTPLPTTTAPTWAGSPAIDLSNIASWQNYRYDTTQTIVPMRNVIWQGSQASYQGGAGAC